MRGSTRPRRALHLPYIKRFLSHWELIYFNMRSRATKTNENLDPFSAKVLRDGFKIFQTLLDLYPFCKANLFKGIFQFSNVKVWHYGWMYLHKRLIFSPAQFLTEEKAIWGATQKHLPNKNWKKKLAKSQKYYFALLPSSRIYDCVQLILSWTIFYMCHFNRGRLKKRTF